MSPFRAVFNDMYAKDISKKVRAALTAKKQSGKFIGASAPYGYEKDSADKNHLVPDPAAAPRCGAHFQPFFVRRAPLPNCASFNRRRNCAPLFI